MKELLHYNIFELEHSMGGLSAKQENVKKLLTYFIFELNIQWVISAYLAATVSQLQLKDLYLQEDTYIAYFSIITNWMSLYKLKYITLHSIKC